MSTPRNPGIEIWKCFVRMLLLGAWAWIQYSLGSKSYLLLIASFIIVFSLTSLISRPARFILLAFSVAAIALSTTATIQTSTQLIRANIAALENPKASLTNLFSPNSGQGVLPAQVRDMLWLLQDHHIASYQLSMQFDQDGEMKQRITEAAWPIRLDSTSSDFIGSLAELENRPGCAVIDHKGEVALAYCR